MSEIIQLESLSLDTLTELAKESFADCQDALQVYLDNEKKLKRFGDILRACREKVPHGQWQQWVLDTFAGHLSLRAVQLWIAEAQEPEKRQKRLDDQKTRDQKTRSKAQSFALLPEQPSAPPVSSGVIRNEDPPAPQSQPESFTERGMYHSAAAQIAKPAWLADPDELDRPEETDLPPLPKTNTHHTAANRRTPDARETDRAGIVCPDDPRGLQDGGWYAWSEDRNRLLPLTDEDILRRADEIRGQMVVGHAVITSPVAEPPNESVSSKPGKVPTLSQLLLAVEGKTDWTHALRESARDWAAYKMTLAGKDKIRSMESWQKALTRMGNVARDRSVADVCEAIEKAIANGWTGWEHLETNDRKSRGMAGGRIYSQLERAQVKYDPLPE